MSLCWTVVGGDGYTGAFGNVRQCPIGRYARHPFICPSCDSCPESYLLCYVHEQILKRTSSHAGFIDIRPLRGNVGRQHGTERSPFADKSIDPVLRHRANKLTEELNVAAKAPVRRVRRAHEEMRAAGPLDHEDLRVQMIEEAVAPVPIDVIPGEARRRIELEDIQVSERVRRKRVEFLPARDEHSFLAGPWPEDTPKHAVSNER